jgi:hypothetical protein
VSEWKIPYEEPFCLPKIRKPLSKDACSKDAPSETRAEKNGRLIEKDMDAALSIVTSLDGERKVIFWWNPGKNMIANYFIPCILEDSYFGTLEPGEEAYAEGLFLFTEGDINPIVKYLLERSEAGGKI